MKLLNPYDLDLISGQPLNLDERTFSARANEIIEIEFKRLRPLALVKDIVDLFKNDAFQWSLKKTYAVNDLALWNDKLWKAKQISVGVEPIEGNEWQEVELYTFYKNFVLKWLATEMYIALLIEQGVNITRYSVANPQDPTYSQVGSADRTRVIARRKSMAESYFKTIEIELQKINYTIDGKKYKDESCKPSRIKGVQIYSAGGNVRNINEY